MQLNHDTKILLVGLGLIGGSYAEGLTQKGYTVGALDIRPSAIDFALQKGIIASGRSTVDPAYLADFDLIIFSLYPHIFVEWIAANQQYLKQGALLTDVTGVKGSVVGAVQSMLRDDLEFIPAHPMAGREQSGVEFATSAIFQNANYIITPTDKNTPEAIAVCRQLGQELGFANISCLTPAEHDEIVGFVSQLTHCIAVSLMTCRDTQAFARYTGDSFRDLTRIAKINDEMWSELFLQNKDALLAQMEQFERTFADLKHHIETENVEEMRHLMQLSSQRREFFDRPKPNND